MKQQMIKIEHFLIDSLNKLRTELERKMQPTTLILYATILAIIASQMGSIKTGSWLENVLSQHPADIFFLVIILLTLGWRYKVLRLFKASVFTWLDLVGLIIIIASAELVVIGRFIQKVAFLNIYVILIGCGLVLFGFRIKQILKSMTPSGTIADLGEVLNGKLNDSALAISETASHVDLLNRSEVVDAIADTLNTSKFNERLVIGINGKWGSGKTTIIELACQKVRNNRATIIIRNFDPWLSDNKEAIVRNLFTRIFKEADLGLTTFEINKFIRSILGAVLGKQTNWFTFLNTDDTRSLANMQQDLERLLLNQNKKIVIVIDNLDRIEPRNVLFMLNIVNNVLTFKNVIIILSYDLEVLRESLDNVDVNKEFVSKIVQQEYHVPLLESVKTERIFYDALNVFGRKYGRTSESYMDDLKQVSQEVFKDESDLRDFKRWFNSGLLAEKKQFQIFDFIDYLVISYLKFRHNDVYLLLSNNLGILCNQRVRPLMFSDDELKVKLDDLFLKVEEAKGPLKLIGMIFPYAKVYLDNEKHNYTPQNTNYSIQVKSDLTDVYGRQRVQGRIFADSYFYANLIDYELYFQKLTSQLDQFINRELVLDDVLTELDSQEDIVQDVGFRMIGDTIWKQRVPYEKIKKSISALIVRIRDEFKLNSDDFNLTIRHIYLLVELSLELSMGDFNQVWGTYLQRDEFFHVIARIPKWKEASKLQNSSSDHIKTEEELDKIQKMFDASIYRFIDDNIVQQEKNLFSANNCEKGLFGLVIRSANETQKASIKTYIERYLTKENVFRVFEVFLKESISLGTPPSFSYQIDEDILAYFDLNKMERLLHERKRIGQLNDAQQMAVQIFDNYRSDYRDEFGELRWYNDIKMDYHELLQ